MIPAPVQPPIISVPVQYPMPMALQTTPPIWPQQQVVICPGPCVQTQPVPSTVPFVPLPQVAQPIFTPVLIDHNESESDQGMDIVDDDGDSWMRPDGIGEEITPSEPAPVALIQTPVIPTNDAIQPTHAIEPPQRPTVGQTWELLDPNARRLRKKVRASRLPYGPRPSVTPFAPSTNRWVGRLRRRVQPRRSGAASTRHYTRNKDIARAARLERRSLLRKKLATRSPKPQCSKEPTLLCVDEQPTAADPTPLVDPLCTQRKARTYHDRLHKARASPFSQRGPSEVSLLASKVAPKSTSSRKAFILQRRFEAMDRRTAGLEGRTNVIRQNDPTAGQQTVAGSRQRFAPLQGKALVGDYVCPRRKRKTAADFIRAEDAEKEKETLEAAVESLQSLGLNSEASVPASSSFVLAASSSVPASSSSVPASDPPVPSPTTLLPSVAQDPQFNQDQAQLFLEDIFEDCEKKQSGLAAVFSSSSSGSSSDSGSDDD